MDKQQYFDNLHNDLSVRFGLTVIQVSTIRSSVLERNMSRRSFAELMALKLSQPVRSGHKRSHRNTRSHPKKHYQTILNFVASCSSEAWADITKKTPFDKQGGERTTHQSQDFGNTAPTIQAHPHAE